ncbi:MAG: LysR substrate-binding domain-containing protein [Gammaproteobacteria bacterium]|nr:LysR substrate-binding domain-containing protein [Gammaproteobacteria bacterium]
MQLLPTLKQLEYLIALDDTRHFGRAAARCYITPSTLSAGIQDLERTLGVAVAERTKRRVIMTPIGQEIATRGRALLRDARDIMDLASTRRHPLGGDLRLGAIPTISPFLLPGVLPGLRQRYPELRLFLAEDKTDALLGQLREGRIDLALIALPYDIGDLEQRTLFADPFHFACSIHHPLASRSTVDPKTLTEQPLLLLGEGHCLRGHALDACQLGSRRVREQYEASSLHTLVQMAATGIGVTLLPRLAIEAGITSGTDLAIVPLKQAVQRQIVLVWRPTSLRKPDFVEFGDALQELSMQG